MNPVDLTSYREDREACVGRLRDEMTKVLAEASREIDEQTRGLCVEAALEVIASAALTLQDTADQLAIGGHDGEPLAMPIVEQMVELALQLVVMSRALEHWARQGQQEAAP